MKQTWVSERHWMMVHTIDRFTELERRNYCLHQPFKPIIDTQLLMFDSNNVTYQTEREMHQRFANARIRGEWFRPVPELLAYIAEIKARAA